MSLSKNISHALKITNERCVVYNLVSSMKIKKTNVTGPQRSATLSLSLRVLTNIYVIDTMVLLEQDKKELR